MNTEQKTKITIDHRFTEEMRVEVESDREDKEITVTQWGDGTAYYITLTHEQAYKLIDLMKTAMEVKL